MKPLKQLFMLSLLLLSAGTALAQGGVLTNPNYRRDGVYDKENSPNRRPIPYAFLREADVMWTKRIWRTLDLREKVNHPLYFPITPIQDRISLFDCMKTALMAGQLTAFGNAALDDEFKVALTVSELEAMFIKMDTLFQEDINNPGSMVATPVKNEITSEDVKQYWIKEDWFFDKQRSVLDVRILGIAPLRENKGDNGEVRGYTPMFWIYFPEVRPILAKTEVYNRANDAERRTLEDIFWKRQFGSFIHKESNVYDRAIVQYRMGLDALLEAEKIKEKMFTYEHDMWHF